MVIVGVIVGVKVAAQYVLRARKVTPPVRLQRQLVLAVHEMLLAQHGGATGIRDEGLLDSALTRPQNLFAYGSPDLADLAAAYAPGLVGNHPLLDGNKRIGFAAAAIFLDRNGRPLVVSETEATQATLDLAAGRIAEPAYAQWLCANSSPS